MTVKKVAILLFLCFFISTNITKVSAEGTTKKELIVKSYYGEYNTKNKQSGLPAATLDSPITEEWKSPEKAKKTYRLGVLFPHLKDPYFLAVNYGIIEEAKKYGISIKLLSAGGYGELEKQKTQLKALAKEGVDGIILAAISYTGLDSLVAEIVQKGIPIIEVINDIYAPDIQAKALVSFYEMGSRAAEFVIKDSKEGEKIKVAFFPGPQGSGWAPDTLKGFFAVQRNHPNRIKLLPPKWGDTGYKTQRMLLEALLHKHNDIDYIVGNAVAAEEAIKVLKEMGLSQKVKIVSTYIIPTIYERIQEGSIKAAPSDLTVSQGKMVINMMVRLLNGEIPGKDFPFRAGPLIPIISQDNIEQFSYEQLFGEKDFKPVYNLNF